jgi:hypothetical protein
MDRQRASRGWTGRGQAEGRQRMDRQRAGRVWTGRGQAEDGQAEGRQRMDRQPEDIRRTATKHTIAINKAPKSIS